MKLRFLGLCIGLLCLGVAAACSSGDSSPSDVETPTATAGSTEAPAPAGNSAAEIGDQDPVAIVNNEGIALEEFERQLEQVEASYTQQGVPIPQGDALTQLRQQVLQQLVQRTLVIQESDARSITATDEEIDAYYQSTLASFPDEETFKQALEREGLDQGELETLIAENIKVEKLLTAVLTEAQIPEPTEEELQELYDTVSQQQELPPFEEIREALVLELQDRRENAVLQSFIEELEGRSNIQILVDL